MSDTASGQTEETATRLLRIVGVQLAVVSAAIHLWWGLPRALVYLRVGTVADPRPYLFVVSAVAVVVGVAWLYAGGPRRKLYALGASVMALYAVGYVWWHLGGHGGAIPGVQGYGHPDLSNLGVLLSDGHLFRPLDALAMVTQLGALACFLGLLFGPVAESADTPASDAESA
jgi:hypothetical protein